MPVELDRPHPTAVIKTTNGEHIGIWTDPLIDAGVDFLVEQAKRFRSVVADGHLVYIGDRYQLDAEISCEDCKGKFQVHPGRRLYERLRWQVDVFLYGHGFIKESVE